ncbi:MAG: hypothetical protein HYZ89_06920, partial [Candidatus Omnitrophica bacterium]|nr:hypothetical protein [Candidatus Omnitrophota bacterium]
MSPVGVFIAVMTVLYPLAMFRGLEPYSGYFGNVYHALHPDSFPNDPFMSPDRPTMQSLLYVVVKMTGEFWLDDRVTLLLFMGMAAITLIGIDKTLRVLGAQRVGERVAMLSMMLLGHQLLVSHAFVIDMLDFSPTVFAAPPIVWLLYGSLSGSRMRQVIPLMLLIPLISLKSAA